mmetsp:Transcript_13365/g.13283  ORF Transcript_13365/g.13283 Transcript_13365/m.13283 type:complete len:246 (+) Transcript_13365:22-759(+)|eukprot:CAMPEP_0197005488 /NCGR_PEP_ID=MMETSP1380-20130617/29609_1 /TAXON_ID=5936 /ORGANISM="Euplotes crassus, Strain CT5" /LENGTH=245 /DNA_ID=CAMNT_0042424645 /DNA_START=13 /DNA_END=750 /DNA_ORIENTATION=+
MSYPKNLSDADSYATFSESLLKKDLSTDTEFLASLLTWNNGNLSVMLNSVVKNICVKEFLEPAGQNSKNLKENHLKKERKQTSSPTSAINIEKTCFDSQSSGDHSQEENKNGVLSASERTLVEPAEKLANLGINSKATEMRVRKRSRRQRMDVVFKTVLRAIRRHYTKIFKVTYPQTRRLSQRPTILTQLNIMKSFVKEIFDLSKVNEELTFFVMGLINNKLFDSCIRAGYVSSRLGKEVTEMFE